MTRSSLCAVGLWCCLLSACDDTTFNTNEQASGVFLEDVLEIVDSECISCHSGLTAEAGLDLSTDFCGEVLDGRVVVPEQPELSLLYLRMVSPSEPMPPSGRLPETDHRIVEAWINDGAPCDGASTVDPGLDTGLGDDPGPTLYANYCAGCHGADGGGGAGPRMQAAVSGKSAADVQTIIRAGSGTMPAIPLDTQEAEVLAEWCLETFGG